MFAEPKIDEKILALWDAVVRQANKLKPTDPLPASTETGRYIKFAYDSAGRLAMPHGKGRRIKPHRNLRKLQQIQDLSFLAEKFFMSRLQTKFQEVEAAARLTSPYVLEPLTMETATEMKLWAMQKAHQIIKTASNAERQARQQRQSVARQINFGIIPGDHNKAAHANA